MGTGMGMGMGNGNDNLCKKLHQQIRFRTLSLSSQIEPEISLALACETNQGRRRLGTMVVLILFMGRTAERIWRRSTEYNHQLEP